MVVLLVAAACGTDGTEPSEAGTSAKSAQEQQGTTESPDPATQAASADSNGSGSSDSPGSAPVDGQAGDTRGTPPPAPDGEESSGSPDGPVPDLPTEPVAPSAVPSSEAPSAVEPAFEPSQKVAEGEVSRASPPAVPDEPSAPTPPGPPPAPPTTWPAFVLADLEWEAATILVFEEDVNVVVPVYDGPDGNRLTFHDGALWSSTDRDNPLVVRVTQGTEGDAWVEAELPIRPNGARGWIRTDRFNWSTVTHHIFVDLSDRRLAFFEGDELITHTRVIVGKPQTPTPAVLGFIVEKLPNHERQNFSIVMGGLGTAALVLQ